MATTAPTKPPLKYLVLNPVGTTADAIASRAAMLTYAAGIKASAPETAELIIGWEKWLSSAAGGGVTASAEPAK